MVYVLYTYGVRLSSATDEGDDDETMATRAARHETQRTPLDRERVLRAAVALADERGIESLSMRKLGQELGVEAMSLYNHVANKEDILTGMVDVVSGEFAGPTIGVDWRSALRDSAISAHEVLLRHPWACALGESRSQAGPARMGYLESVVRTMLDGGLSIELAYQANMMLDSYIYGFTLQEVSWPNPPADFPQLADAFIRRLEPDEYPSLIRMAEMVAGPDFDPSADYERGLDLILDSLERLLAASR